MRPIELGLPGALGRLGALGRRGNSGRRLRLAVPATLAAATLIATSLAGCVTHQEQLTGSCGVVVDGSQSGDQAKGFNAEHQLKVFLPTFLINSDCRYVVFSPINGDSLSSVCTEPMLDIDPADLPDNANVPALISANRGVAASRASAELHCARFDKLSHSGASDIIGGLQRIAQELPPKSGPYNVLVVSDFISFSSSLNLLGSDLSTQAKRTAIVTRLAGEGQVPNLAGVNVYTAGFGYLFGRDAERRTQFGDFWSEFMTRAHVASFQPER